MRRTLEPTLREASPPRTLAEVEQWSQRLTTALRKEGFPIGQVLMTESDWDRGQGVGEFVFTVFPGRVSRIGIANTSRVKEQRLRRLVGRALCGQRVMCPDDAPAANGEDACLFESSRFERTTQLLQDLPGVALDGAPQFGPGAGTGDVEANFAIRPKGKPWSFDASMDNSGMAATGRTRVGVSVRTNNIFGLGDDYAASATVTSKGMWAGSFNASVPVFSDGLRLAGGFSRQQYAVNAVGTSFAGVANTGSLGLTYPFTRGLDFNLWGSAAYLHSDTSVDYSDFGFSIHGKIDALKVSLAANSGDRAQQLRSSLWSATAALTVGRQSNDDPLDAGPRRAGSYAKLSGSAFGRLTLDKSGDLFATAGASGQLASRNLDSSEKLTLGGPGGVRAYRADEGSADEGVIVSLGLYKRFSFARGHQIQLGPIADFAIARVNAHPWAGWEQSYVSVPDVANTRKLAGYGAEAAWLTPFGATLLVSASRPFGFSDSSWIEPGKRPAQYWLSLTWSH